MVAALTALVALAGGGCERPAPAPANECPPGYAIDPARTKRLHARLRSDAEATRLLEATKGQHPTCYGPIDDSAVDERGRLLIRSDQSDSVAAARAAHLLKHLVDGSPFDPKSTEPCAQQLARARGREEQAHGLERRLRQRFGAPPLPAAALDEVLAGYQHRCQKLQSKRPGPTASARPGAGE